MLQIEHSINHASRCVQAHSDVYSFGMVLYEVISSEWPFVTRSLAEQIAIEYKICADNLRPTLAHTTQELAATVYGVPETRIVEYCELMVRDLEISSVLQLSPADMFHFSTSLGAPGLECFGLTQAPSLLLV